MPRNQEVIRQWKILHALTASRHGATINALADELGVTTRTIRRDLDALQEAGFPLVDEREQDGPVHWRLAGPIMRGLEVGFTLPELCALYLSRNLLEAVGITPFQRDLGLAYERLAKMLSPRMRKFLDELPEVLSAKPGPRPRIGGEARATVEKLLEATLQHRVVSMRYDSVSSGRVKTYEVHPHRLEFAQGGLYLLAYVPAYEDVRTFAVERVAAVSLLKQTFKPRPLGDQDPFSNSLGVNTGPAARVDVAFDAKVAPYVRARVWHTSQQIRDAADGSLVLSMTVCHDWPLRSWILSWGPFARVLAPSSLAEEVRRDHRAGFEQYVTGRAPSGLPTE